MTCLVHDITSYTHLLENIFNIFTKQAKDVNFYRFIWNSTLDSIKFMFDEIVKKLNRQILVKTLSKYKIPEDQSIEYYRRLQVINYQADRQSRSWNFYCQARYFFKVKKMYGESIDLLE